MVDHACKVYVVRLWLCTHELADRRDDAHDGIVAIWGKGLLYSCVDINGTDLRHLDRMARVSCTQGDRRADIAVDTPDNELMQLVARHAGDVNLTIEHVVSGTNCERVSSTEANAKQQHPKTTTIAATHMMSAFFAALIFFSDFLECAGEAGFAGFTSLCFVRFFASYFPALIATESIEVAAATLCAFLRTVLFELPLAIHTPCLRETKSVDFTTARGTVLA